MIKIVFFLKNELLPYVDYSTVTNGNPGVGGTEYLFVLNAYLLSQRAGFDVSLYVQRESKFPCGLIVKYVSDIKAGLEQCVRDNIDYYVFRESKQWVIDGVFENCPKNIKIILWSHIFMQTKNLDVYAKCPNVKGIVCVGREQLDLYRGHKAFEKMDYIYNSNVIPSNSDTSGTFVDVKNRRNIVTYVGSLNPFKGFHYLAKAWPKIITKVPDAELYVIGSGNLYDANKQMGIFGLASSDYENMFMPYLTDKDGKILQNVHFMGRMGEEKNEILKKTKVGIPNPSGATETFGLGAVEMQAMGCCVVTIRCCGYLDTVLNTENLYSNTRQLADYVIKNLENPNFDYSNTYRFIKSKFDYNVVIDEWVSYFKKQEKGSCRIHAIDNNIKNESFRCKWLRIVIQKINERFNYILPSVCCLEETIIIRKINRLITYLEWKF